MCSLEQVHIISFSVVFESKEVPSISILQGEAGLTDWGRFPWLCGWWVADLGGIHQISINEHLLCTDHSPGCIWGMGSGESKMAKVPALMRLVFSLGETDNKKVNKLDDFLR